jgi:NDP-sugar pyrophosphorylase family protein
MAGAGARFSSTGNAIPKPLLKIQEHYFFEIAAMGLNFYLENYSLSFIVLSDHCSSFKIDSKIYEVFPNAQIAVLGQPTSGAAESAYLGMKQLDLRIGPLIVADCDQWIEGDNLRLMIDGLEKKSFDIAFPNFHSTNPQYSYVACDSEGKVSKILEKEPISTKAVAGCYGFRSVDLFNELYLAQENWGSEKYMSDIIARGMADKYSIRTFEIELHVPFGTPAEYEEAVLNKHLMRKIHEW